MDNRPLPLRTLACGGSDFHGDPLLTEMYKRPSIGSGQTKQISLLPGCTGRRA
ncbi:MAG: hypothetical protein QOH98_762, partial [Methylobacteriaceae bacterium]|nr:hypothetical protein [Methylobacteriaceae bacterium]